MFWPFAAVRIVDQALAAVLQNPLRDENPGDSCLRGGLGWREYGDPDPNNGGRATGIEACLDTEWIETHPGSSTQKDINPPGTDWAKDFARYLGLLPSADINKCHLLADTLSGEGGRTDNLVPCSRATNFPKRLGDPGRMEDNMRKFEGETRAAVDAGSIVHYRVVPVYAGPRTVPYAIEMYAYGTDRNGIPNFALSETVANTIYSPRVGSVNMGLWTDSRTGSVVPTN
ncbi:DNA/RNA non-specific endonuclease [Kitasatospora paranensis]